MPNLTVQLAGTITVTDTSQSPSPSIIIRNLGGPALAATVVFFDPFFQALITGSSVPLPGSPAFFLYIKNIDGTNNLTVNWTTVGGGSQVFTLPPPTATATGSVFVYACTSETAGGVTAVTLTGNNTTTSAEVLLAK